MKCLVNYVRLRTASLCEYCGNRTASPRRLCRFLAVLTCFCQPFRGSRAPTTQLTSRPATCSRPRHSRSIYEIIRPELLRTGVRSGMLPVNVVGRDPVTMYVSVSARVGPGGAVNESVMYGHGLSPADSIASPDGPEVDDATGLLRRSAFDERARMSWDAWANGRLGS
jgi:hypothetical protein